MSGTNREYKLSREFLERARGSMPGGVSSPFRAKAAVPLFFREAKGCRLTDVDGNKYIDYALSWGPSILGHCHPRIVEAMREAAERPHIYGAQHELEYQVAEEICRMAPCAERVSFTSSGTEAVQVALRVARAHTGRNLILKFEGHYHGWVDSVLLSHHPKAGQLGDPERPNIVPESRGQVANAAENMLVARWNRAEDVERAFTRHPGEIAAVIMEPVLCNSGCIQPREGYLRAVREICDAHGALLIFDEIITGFRLGLGGAQGLYGVTPDLATFGKAIAGGLPLSVLTGRAEPMELIGHGVSFGGTFNGNPVSLAAARATLQELARDGGEALARARESGEALIAGIRSVAQLNGIQVLVAGRGPVFALHFTPRTELIEYRDVLDDDAGRLRRFLELAVGAGIWSVPDGRFYVSAAHREEDVQETLVAFEGIFKTMASE